jgi:hypothetical protein
LCQNRTKTIAAAAKFVQEDAGRALGPRIARRLRGGLADY